MGSRKIASEPGDLGQIIGKGSTCGHVLSGSCKAVDQGDFDIGQDKPRRSVRSGAVDHGHPEQAPGQNAEYGDQIGKPLGGPQPCIFGSAAGFEYLVEEFDLPTLGIPVELFDGFVGRCYRQIGDEPPVDRRASFRRSTLSGV